jgi:Uma2 family endonuclease
MSPEQRAVVVAALPSEFDFGPPEGDLHRLAKERARDPLERFFRRIGRRVYLSSELPVYYPEEPVFAPDLLAVVEAQAHPRERWVVSDEGRGLDFVLEVCVGGSRKKDLKDNVVFYAKLGIPEYFVFEVRRELLRGFTLVEGRAGAYQPILGQQGRYPSTVLGLDLSVSGGELRFFYGDAAVPETRVVLAQAQALVDEVVRKREEAEAELAAAVARAEEQARLREQEARLREAAEARLAEALEELERLRRER